MPDDAPVTRILEPSSFMRDLPVPRSTAFVTAVSRSSVVTPIVASAWCTSVGLPHRGDAGAQSSASSARSRRRARRRRRRACRAARRACRRPSSPRRSCRRRRARRPARHSLRPLWLANPTRRPGACARRGSGRTRCAAPDRRTRCAARSSPARPARPPSSARRSSSMPGAAHRGRERVAELLVA